MRLLTLTVGTERRLQVGAGAPDAGEPGPAPAGLIRPESTPAIASPPSSPGMNACTSAAAPVYSPRA
jgi:hypothetical protein